MRCFGPLLLFVSVVSASRAGTPPPGFTETTVVGSASSTGAASATGIAYEPGTGNLWVLEKGSSGTARVRVRNATSGSVSTALTLPCVDSAGERGLLGIAFDPDWLAGPSTRRVYLYYTRSITSSGSCAISGVGASSRNRVSRFLESSGTLSGEEVLYQTPALTGATNHNAGTVRFGNDGTLFVSIGDNDTDAASNPLSRDLGDPRGKMLRLNADGSVPPDNPFVGRAGALPEIWAYGLRNPFRFSIDPESGAPFVGDVGENTWEAIYAGVAGADYGYPCYEASMPFRSCSSSLPIGGVTGPIYVYGHGSLTPPVSGNSVTGGLVYRHDAFPEEYRGNYFFGDFGAGWIRRARIGTTGLLESIEMFIPDAGGVVDFAVSPAGCLAYVPYGGATREVCYVGGSNGQPRAVASAAPTAGLAPLSVQLTGSASSDPDGDTLTHSWAFGDGTSGSTADPAKTYASNGVYNAVLTVDDQRGEADSTDSSPPVRIVVGNRAPSITITQPVAGTTYDAGDSVAFRASATDPEDGTLAANRFSWTVAFHHAGHVHPFAGPYSGTDAGQFVVPTSGEDAADVFFRVYVTATDSGSPLGSSGRISTTTFVDVHPNVSVLTLAASPAGIGLALEIDHAPGPAPISRPSVVGFPRTVGAPSPQTIGSQTWVFSSWSDGGAAEHTVPTPGADTTLVATFVCAAGCGGVDGDGDGFAAGVDCDDGDPEVYPGAVEICDGEDDDCDGTPDDGCRPAPPTGVRVF
jgi:glucose/arabinose dehydrogenase